MIRILLGGSPCTYWSIAQKNNRETEASGMGWELFKNYLIAKEKFKPDYFLYENNVSAAQPIKDQIKRELGVWDGTFLMPYTDVRYIEINSALVSAQNRERFYVHNCGEVQEPKDKGTLLRDVLGSGVSWKEKCNTIGRWEENHKVIEPVGVGYRNRREADGKLYRRFETGNEPKANAITTVQTDSMVAIPFQVGSMPRPNGELSTSQAFRIYDINAKSVTINAGGGGAGGKTGLYAEPLEQYNYATEFDESGKPTKAYCYADGKIHTVYEVKDRKITIKGKEYPIKLSDGFYIIRKLTVAECRRLQTIPDWYKMPCSDTQNYKMLGNGWTVEVIKHILSHIPEIRGGGATYRGPFNVRRNELRSNRLKRTRSKRSKILCNRNRQVRHTDNAGEFPEHNTTGRRISSKKFWLESIKTNETLYLRSKPLSKRQARM